MKNEPGATLDELHRLFVAACRKVRRLAKSSDPKSGNWATWNAEVEIAAALADRIARAKAETAGDLLIKIDALQWWCREFDAFADAEGYQRLTIFARNLRRYVEDNTALSKTSVR